MNRYFGRKGETNQDIIAELKDEAEDAINRTLEVLRNRIDQFGVSEPSITKQGSNRIVIELAGVFYITIQCAPVKGVGVRGDKGLLFILYF